MTLVSEAGTAIVTRLSASSPISAIYSHHELHLHTLEVPYYARWCPELQKSHPMQRRDVQKWLCPLFEMLVDNSSFVHQFWYQFCWVLESVWNYNLCSFFSLLYLKNFLFLCTCKSPWHKTYSTAESTCSQTFEEIWFSPPIHCKSI